MYELAWCAADGMAAAAAAAAACHGNWNPPDRSSCWTCGEMTDG